MNIRFAVLAMVYSVVALTTTLANTNGTPTPMRTSAQIETELRAVIAGETKWVSAMKVRLDLARAVLENKDLPFVPGAGPVRSDDEYTYLASLAKRRYALIQELLARRALEAQETPIRPVPSKDGESDGIANKTSEDDRRPSDGPPKPTR